MAAWFLLQPCVTPMPTATCPWENLATVTGSVRADTLGCSAAPPCWCLTADRWGVLFRPLRTVKCQRHSRPSQTSWSRMGNRTSQMQPPDPTCPLGLCRFLSGTGPGTNIDFSKLKCIYFSCCLQWNINRVCRDQVQRKYGHKQCPENLKHDSQYV